jgi:hypothetical protein
MNARLKTNESFRARRDRLHHNNELTPLLHLGIDIVKFFLIDYMHLIRLDTFKCYLRIILHGNVAEEEKIHKLSLDMIERFDDLIELLGEYLSSEFNRKGKSSKKLRSW